MKLLVWFSAFFFLSPTLSAQDIRQHRWENRLILLLAEDPDNAALTEQLATLRTAPDDLAERKLLIYQITPHRYTLGMEGAPQAPATAGLYNRYRTAEASFTVLLIGLDGGIKLRREQVVSVDELFALIDTMPMRQAEMRKVGR